MVFFAMHVGTGRNAVIGAVGAGREAEVAPIPQVGSAHSTCLRADRTVGQRALRLGFLLVFFTFFVVVQDGDAGNVVVVGVADQAVDMQYPVPAHAVQAEHAGALVVDGIAAHFGAATQWLVGNGFSQAAVDHVDRAADGAAAEQQGGRSLQHFDLVGEEGFDADRVVGRDRGRVHRADATGQHLHARAFLAADDRAADARAEVGGLHARQLGDGLAKGAGFGLVQVFAVQHVHRGRDGFRVAFQRRSGDHHGLQVFGLGIAGGLGERGRGGQGQGEGGGEQAGSGALQGEHGHGVTHVGVTNDVILYQ